VHNYNSSKQLGTRHTLPNTPPPKANPTARTSQRRLPSPSKTLVAASPRPRHRKRKPNTAERVPPRRRCASPWTTEAVPNRRTARPSRDIGSVWVSCLVRAAWWVDWVCGCTLCYARRLFFFGLVFETCLFASTHSSRASLCPGPLCISYSFLITFLSVPSSTCVSPFLPSLLRLPSWPLALKTSRAFPHAL